MSEKKRSKLSLNLEMIYHNVYAYPASRYAVDLDFSEKDKKNREHNYELSKELESIRLSSLKEFSRLTDVEKWTRSLELIQSAEVEEYVKFVCIQQSLEFQSFMESSESEKYIKTIKVRLRNKLSPRIKSSDMIESLKLITP